MLPLIIQENGGNKTTQAVCLQIVLFVGLIILVDQATNLTSWFASPNTDVQSFSGVQLYKRNTSLVVSYSTGNSIVTLHQAYITDF